MRIRKFNESSEKEIDSEYIKQCFMDFFDNGTARMQSGSSAAYGNWVEIRIDTEKIKGLKEYNNDYERSRRSSANWVTNTDNISKYADGLIKNSELIREIEICLKRIADEYPDYAYKIWSNGLNGNLEKSDVVLSFWP
jgi:hypothetical protein